VRRSIARIAVSSSVWALVPIAVCAAPADNPSTSSIEIVVVQGQKLNVETKIDRKIYTVLENAQSTLGTLSDILNVMPSVDVDPDGMVSLRGDPNVLFLIDGKLAQFKADGAAGVINIVTRKRAAKSRRPLHSQGASAAAEAGWSAAMAITGANNSRRP